MYLQKIAIQKNIIVFMELALYETHLLTFHKYCQSFI